MVDRISKAKIAVFQLGALGVSNKGIHIVKAIRMYKCLM